jgi:hypothetical protein
VKRSSPEGIPFPAGLKSKTEAETAPADAAGAAPEAAPEAAEDKKDQ